MADSWSGFVLRAGSVALITLSTMVGSHEVWGKELEVGAGYPIGGFSQEEPPQIGLSAAGRIQIGPGVRMELVTSVQQYREVGGELLDTRYWFVGVGIEGRYAVPNLRPIEVTVRMDPSVVASRWRRAGLNNSHTTLGLILGAGVRVPVFKQWGLGTNVKRYLSEDGETIHYFDAPPLELPGVASTLIELAVQFGWP